MSEVLKHVDKGGLEVNVTTGYGCLNNDDSARLIGHSNCLVTICFNVVEVYGLGVRELDS